MLQKWKLVFGMKSKRKVNNDFMHLSQECSGNLPNLVKKKIVFI